MVPLPITFDISPASPLLDISTLEQNGKGMLHACLLKALLGTGADHRLPSAGWNYPSFP